MYFESEQSITYINCAIFILLAGGAIQKCKSQGRCGWTEKKNTWYVAGKRLLLLTY